ncbi:MAG TPA: aldo/keto reductase [Rhodoglobus sp.]|nr:aldo/keto reductase [Rhodoglobus sp.]HOT33608.1 aldo/keto reductase [Rhodoglobus sp.]HOY81449.1 aldo/keto reductase [Rhodoglobus sp.]HPG75447.1 aldo/keto reductase [Rhodoglobus sp.]HPM50622.1 aldo/keto reductase [Rhodoglobus sp.]
MRSTTLGRAPALSEIGLGTSTFGNLYRETTDAETVDAVDVAWAGGVRYFDTAPHYGLGLAERRLGAALAGRPRDEFVVSTKVGRALVPTPENAHQLDDDGFHVPAEYRREWDFSRDGILRSLEQSLTRLGMDRVDVLYLHDPDHHWEQASTEGIATLIELRDQGVVRAIGAGMNQSAMLARFVRECDVDLVMLAGRFTLLDQGALDDLLPIALERGVGVVAAGVYNSGLLGRAVVPDDAHYEYQAAPAELLARARAIAELCGAHGVTLPDAAVQFPLRHPAVVSAVLGARNGEQMQGGLDRDSAPIPDALWSDLEAAGFIPSLA